MHQHEFLVGSFTANKSCLPFPECILNGHFPVKTPWVSFCSNYHLTTRVLQFGAKVILNTLESTILIDKFRF